jgi:two-component system, cell cycle response regulator
MTHSVLIVDDHELSRHALAGLLESEGYTALHTGDGHSALQIAHDVRPDLILLDIMMPGLDGYEVCRRLRNDPLTATVPILMLTALDDQDSRVRGLEAGADDFISKPFQRLDLRARVRTITRLNRYRLILDSQRRLDRTQAQLIWALEQSQDGYLLLDRQDRISHANQRARQLLAIDDDSPSLTFHQRAQQHYRCEPQAAWASWPAGRFLRYLVRPHHEHPALWLQVHVPADEQDEYQLIRLQDVSAEMRAQKTLWTFHAFISHKLRAPLANLVAALSLLLARLSSTLNPDQQRLADAANRATARLTAVVEDIGRYLDAPLVVTAGQGCRVADLPALLVRAAQALQLPAPQISRHLLDQQRLTLAEQTIEFIVTELFENARKFHPQHSPQLQITLNCSAEMLQLLISDDGRHLPSEELDRIWQPYYQHDPAFTGQIPGTGLGLATIAQICWGCDGSYAVRNRSDRPGITVDMQLPLENNGTTLTTQQRRHPALTAARKEST